MARYSAECKGALLKKLLPLLNLKWVETAQNAAVKTNLRNIYEKNVILF